MSIVVVRINYTDFLGVEHTKFEHDEDFRERCKTYGISTHRDIHECVISFQKLPEFATEFFTIEVIESKWQTMRHAIFAILVEEAGFDVFKYYGRMDYIGPAVNADRADEVTRCVTTGVTIDAMGRGVVVYPQ